MATTLSSPPSITSAPSTAFPRSAPTGGITAASPAPYPSSKLPDTYIDDYSLQLKRGTLTRLEGYVHVTGADSGTHVTLRIPDLHIEKAAVTDTNGRAAFTFAAPGLELWSPDHPRLYAISLHAGPTI